MEIRDIVQEVSDRYFLMASDRKERRGRQKERAKK